METGLLEGLKALDFAFPLLIALFLIARAGRFGRYETGVVIFGFALRVALALILKNVEFPYFANDPAKYNYIASTIANGHPDFYDSLQTNAFAMTGGIIYFFLGQSQTCWAVFNAFAGAATILVVIRTTEELFGKTEAGLAGLVYCVFPSYVLFDSILEREALIILFLSLSVLHFARYLRSGRIRNLCAFAAFVITGGIFRPLFIPLCFGIAYPFMVINFYISEWAKRLWIMRPLILAVFVFMVSGAVIAALYFTPLGGIIMEKLSEEALTGVAQSRASGASAYLADVHYGSVASIIYYTPLKFLYFTFGPFPWLAKGTSGLAASMEGLCNLFFMVFSIGGVRHVMRQNKRLAFFMVLFALAGLAAQGAIDSNYGTALRHRISYSFLFAILSTYTLCRTRVFGLLRDIFLLRGPAPKYAVAMLLAASTVLFLAAPGRSQTVSLPYEDGQIRIWAAPSLEKVDRYFRNADFKNEYSGMASISAAKDEYESFQVVLSNKGRAPIDLNALRVSGLKSKKGDVIPGANIEAFYVGYVNEQYPDVLFPAGVAKYKEEFRAVHGGDDLDLWFTVHVPAGAGSGDYAGTVTLQAGGGSYSVPVSLRVRDFSLPGKTAVSTLLFNLLPRDISERYGLGIFSRKYEDLVRGVFEEYKKHHISNGGAAPVPLFEYYRKKGAEATAAYFEKWCRYWTDAGLECNNLQAPADIERFRDFIKPVYEAVKKNGWMDIVELKLPHDEAKRGEKANANLEWARQARRLAPGIKIQHTFGGLERGLNRAVLESYAGYVDVWSLVPDAYSGDPGIKAFIDGQAKKGARISWYIHRKLNVWQSRAELRRFFWQMWANNVSSVSLWRTDFWSRPEKRASGGLFRGRRIPEKKTWREPRGFGTTKSSGVGNGTLFWPDDDRVLTSIRLETIRDGIEDYEYLQLAKKKGIAVLVPEGADARELMKIRADLARQIEEKK